MSYERYDELDDGDYGYYNEVPHTTVDLNFEEWNEVVKQVLSYSVGPAIAWHYEGGTLHLWGENLDESLVRDLTDATNEIERDYSNDRFYDVAESARRAASKLSRMDIHPPGERIIT